MKLGNIHDISKVNFLDNLLIYNGIGSENILDSSPDFIIRQ